MNCIRMEDARAAVHHMTDADLAQLDTLILDAMDEAADWFDSLSHLTPAERAEVEASRLTGFAMVDLHRLAIYADGERSTRRFERVCASADEAHRRRGGRS